MDFDTITQDLYKMHIGDIKEYEPLYKHTTFRVGGPARWYLSPYDALSLKTLMHYVHSHKIPYFILGKGSNVLFSDKEYNGIIISLSEHFQQVDINGCLIRVASGVSLMKLAYDCAKWGLSGLEFAGGIPGSVGGGLFMNAGAYKHDFSEIVKEVYVLDEHFNIRCLSKEDMSFAYRHSVIQQHPEWIILGGLLEMKAADSKSIQELLDRRKEKRMASQPWNMSSAGSVFRNPDEKPAWQCIDECQLRGYEIGGAQISPKHSNFIVNNGYASAKDILDLIYFTKDTVYEKLGIVLTTEVRLVNWD